MSTRKSLLRRTAAAALTAALLAGVFPLAVQGAEAAEPLSFQGHTYQAFSGGLTWTQARAACEAKGGHLATITSQEELAAIEGYLDGLGGDLQRAYWLGGTDQDQEGRWTWITGEAWTIENWSYGEPNDDFGSTEDYLGMYTPAVAHGGDPYCWNDFTDDARATGVEYMGYLCEWEDDTPTLPTGPVEPDRWSFGNSGENFMEKEEFWGFVNYVNKGYYITRADYDRLVSSSSLPAVDKLRLDPEPWQYQGIIEEKESRYNIDGKSQRFQAWGGSCYGMSVWTCLVGSGELSARDVAGSSTLASYASTLPVQSAINFYMWQQKLTVPTVAMEEFMQLPSQTAQLARLQQLADAADRDGPFLLCYQWYRDFPADGSAPKEEDCCGHAVVGYGSQWGLYTDLVRSRLGERTGDTLFTHRIDLYDCAAPDDPEGLYDLYYSDDGVWAIPGHGIISTDHTAFDTPRNNGQLVLATADPDVLNAVDYTTGYATRPTVYDGILLGYRLGDSLSLDWTGGTDTITGFSSQSGTIPVAVTANLTMAGDTVPTDATAFLPDAAYCTVSSSTPLELQATAGQYLTTVQTDTRGRVTFTDDGGAALNLAATGTYQLQLAANQGWGSLTWDILEVAGDGAQVSLQPTSQGCLLLGDDLTGMTVLGSDGEEQVRLTLSTAAEEVLITDDGKAGRLWVREDKDGDGRYETTVAAAGQDAAFSDVLPGDYFYDAVAWAVAEGITNGVSPTAFGPQQTCTRGQTVTFLWRAAGSPAPKGTAPGFSDVAPDSYCADAVAWAMEQRITNGTGADTFSPNATVTRAQGVTFLYRAMGEPAAAGGGTFSDVPGQAYYHDAVAWAVAEGITNGTSHSTFSPNAPCTRGQIVTFLYRTYHE